MTVIGIQTFLFIWLPPFQGLITPRFYSIFLSEIFMTAGGCQTSVSSTGIWHKDSSGRPAVTPLPSSNVHDAPGSVQSGNRH